MYMAPRKIVLVLAGSLVASNMTLLITNRWPSCGSKIQNIIDNHYYSEPTSSLVSLFIARMQLLAPQNIIYNTRKHFKC